MFYKNPLYENYDHDDYDTTRCCQCFTGCCAGIKNMFKLCFTFPHKPPRNKHLNSKLLLGDDY